MTYDKEQMQMKLFVKNIEPAINEVALEFLFKQYNFKRISRNTIIYNFSNGIQIILIFNSNIGNGYISNIIYVIQYQHLVLKK